MSFVLRGAKFLKMGTLIACWSFPLAAGGVSRNLLPKILLWRVDKTSGHLFPLPAANLEHEPFTLVASAQVTVQRRHVTSPTLHSLFPFPLFRCFLPLFFPWGLGNSGESDRGDATVARPTLLIAMRFPNGSRFMLVTCSLSRVN